MNYNPDECVISQGFGVNPAVYAPLAGHTGIDEGKGYGTAIHTPVDMHVYKVLTVVHPSNDGSGFTGVFGIVDDGIELYELLIGHGDPSVTMGQDVKAGDVIGTEANHGEVFQGGVQITLAEQAAGDHRGSHRHFQKRPVYKSQTKNQPALSAYNDEAGTYRDTEGNYYPIWDYNNGFNGCVSPALSVFTRHLTLKCYGYDVFVLQRILVAEGFLSQDDTTGYFGNLTKTALSAFQAKYNVEPTLGYFGPLTTAAVVEKYHV
jgi:peptidoglycan hydrolase-like protein with peptidoglycan-binding domain